MPELIEIEIKSLLGDIEKAEELKRKVGERGGRLMSKNSQLNHYFVGTDLSGFQKAILPLISEPQKSAFERILDHGEDFSIRTRYIDGRVILVIKASLGEDSSSNGVSRIEFEADMGMTLDKLDKILLDAGLEYQAKWSREREEYNLAGTNICIDKNAGYGYLAEFEKVVTDRSLLDSVKKELVTTMEDFGVIELPQERLERMFAHYNEHWRDYYGTDKVFNIE